MDDQQLNDLLDQHHQTLARGESQAAPPPGVSLTIQAAALFTVINLLWELLRPVQPAPAFRAVLGEQLVAEAQRRRTQEALGISTSQRRSGRQTWLAPVAALGAVSLVGAYAFWRRARQQEEDGQALAA